MESALDALVGMVDEPAELAVAPAEVGQALGYRVR
jgi:hypothetical protein